MESTIQKFSKDITVIAIFNLVIAISGLVMLPLLTKVLGAHDYGIWAQVNVTKSLIIVLAGLGLPNALTRFLAAETNKTEIQEQFYSAFLFIFFITFIVSLFIIIFAGFFAEAFFDGATQIVRITGLICLVWSLDGVCLTFFKAFRQMKRFSILVTANAFTEFGVIAYLILNGYDLSAVVLSVLVVESIFFLVLLYLIKSQIGIRRPHFSRINEYLNFSLPMIPGDISSWVVSLSDKYVIGYFLGAVPVGIYSASYGLGYILFPVAGILSFVLLPTLSKLYDKGRMDEVKILLHYSLKYFLVLAIPFLFGAAILSEPILRLLSIPEIATQGWFITPIVALGITFLGIGNIVTQILVVSKKTKILGVTWVISALLNLSLNILLVPRIGILGAAITTLMAYSLALGIVIYYALEEVRFNIEWSFTLKSLAAAVIMSLVIWRMNAAEINVILTVITGVIVYAIILVLLRGFKRDEWRYAKGLFQRS